MPTDTDEPTKEYFVLHYRNKDSHYAKNSATLYRMYNRYEERWGELPERIEKVVVPTSEWEDYFG